MSDVKGKTKGRQAQTPLEPQEDGLPDNAQKMVVKAAKIRIAPADHGKFGKRPFAHLGPVDDINTQVTDSGAGLKVHQRAARSRD
jgi:DeoR/GlpR family transcriptional regulator of sugar metabolism